MVRPLAALLLPPALSVGVFARGSCGPAAVAALLPEVNDVADVADVDSRLRPGNSEAFLSEDIRWPLLVVPPTGVALPPPLGVALPLKGVASKYCTRLNLATLV